MYLKEFHEFKNSLEKSNKKRKTKHDELKLQFSIVDYLHLQYPKVKFTITCGGLITDARTGSKAKRMGYEAGCPDLIIFKRNRESWSSPLCLKENNGLFIELKTLKGKLSSVQKEWIDYLNDNGYRAVICRSFDEARKEIDEYLGDNK